MSDLTFALLPGDGIGAEVMAHAARLLGGITTATSITVRTEEVPCGGKYYLEHGRDWPDGADAVCRSADAILLGAVGWPAPERPGTPVMRADGHMAGWSAVIGNRVGLDLYANVRPVKLHPGVRHRLGGGARATGWRPEDVDLVIVRENTEGLYAGLGATSAAAGRATDTRVITRRASARVIRHAFALSRARSEASRNGRPRVAAVAKPNLLHGCRLFCEVFDEIAASFPDVARETVLVDAFTVALMQEPERFDVVVTTNLFGDICTDLAAVLQGGMGLATGANLGDDHAMFEPVHGSAPDLAGTDRCNPMAMMLAVGHAFGWLASRRVDPALARVAGAIEASVAALLAAGRPLTADLVASPAAAASTTSVADAIITGVIDRLTSEP
ncbi:MAG: isocitrate/isopropylmalate family dehydrogenase [Myxococcota bacterium]